MTEISRIRLTKDSAWSVATAAFNAFCGITYLIIIGNHWGSEGLGYFALCVSLYMIGSVIFNLGLHFAVLYELAASNNDNKRMSAYAYSALALSIAMGLIGALSVFRGANSLATIFNQPQIEPIIKTFAFALPLFNFNKTIIGILNAQRRMRFIAAVYFIRSGTILLFLISMKISFSPLAIFPYGFLLAESSSAILLITACLRAHKFTLPSAKKAKSLLSFGWKLALSGIFADINYRLDIFVLSLFCNPSLVGVYSIAAAIARGLWLIPDALMKVSNPLIVQLFSSGQKEKLHRTLNILIRFTGSVFIIMGLLCATFIKPLIKFLYPNQPEMLAAAIPLYLLLPGAVIYAGVATIVTAPGASIGMPGNETKRILLMLVINFAMNFALVPFFAAEGAAIATSIAILSSGVFYFFYLVNKHLDFNISIKKYLMLLLFFSLLIAFTAVFENTVSNLLLFGITSTIAITILISLKMIRKPDWLLIRSILKPAAVQ